MMLLLAKRLRLCSVIQSLNANQKIHPILTRFGSGSAAVHSPDLETPDFNVVDYLVTSFGLSPAKAARISKPIAHLKSPQSPDAVLRFLKHEGFLEDDVKKLITGFPGLLCCPEKTLDTHLRALRHIGLSTSALNQIILSGPTALQLRSAVPRIHYWKDFFGGDEAALVRLFKCNRGLIGYDITNAIVPKLSLLKAHGLPMRNVKKILVEIRYFITGSTCRMEQIIKRTKELGIQPESKMFVHGLHAMSCVSREMLEKKVELFKSFGWSEDDFLSVLRTLPPMAWLSENNLRAKMNFLMGEVRCEHTYIASHPSLFTYSLDRRLRPRHHVLKLLETKGLSDKRPEFYPAISIPDTKFVERYVVPYKEDLSGESGLHETYLAACA